MTHVDALSRYSLRCMLVDTSNVGLLTRIEKAQEDDVDVVRISDLISTEDRRIYYEGRHIFRGDRRRSANCCACFVKIPSHPAST